MSTYYSTNCSSYTFCKIRSFPYWLVAVLQFGKRICHLVFHVLHDGIHDFVEGIIRRGIDIQVEVV